MSRSSLAFVALIDKLAELYGDPSPPTVTEPFAMVLWENVAYLAIDSKRAEAFAELQSKVGLAPADIRRAKDSVLLAIASNGIVPIKTVEKLRRSAEIARESFRDDVSSILDKPIAVAKNDLRKFPAIGEPAAEKILLVNHRHPFLALESNGLRVLVRLGCSPEHRNYSTMYKNMQRNLAPQLPTDCNALIRAYQLLRQHGQELCKRTSPHCERCPVRMHCAYFSEVAGPKSQVRRLEDEG
jgi:endonuclease III